MQRGRVGAGASGNVPAPQVAQQITSVDRVDGAVTTIEHERIGEREAGTAGRGGRAHTGRDFLEQRAGARVEDEEVTLAIRVVVARGDDHDPAPFRRLHDDRIAVGVAEVGVGELPQHLARHHGFAQGVAAAVNRGGDVDRVVALAALAQAADQDRAPIHCARRGATRPAEVDVVDIRRRVDHVVVHERRVAQRGEPVHVRRAAGALEECARHIGKQLGAAGCREVAADGVHHAVVRAHVDHGRATCLGRSERGIARVGGIREREAGRSHRAGLGADDVTHRLDASAVRLGAEGRRLFVRLVAAQVFEVVGAVVAGDVARVECSQLRAADRQCAARGARAELSASRAAPGHDATVRQVGRRGRQLRRQPVGEQPRLGQRGGVRSGGERQGAGRQFAGPVGAVVLAAVAAVARLRNLRNRGRERGGERRQARGDLRECRVEAGDHQVGPAAGVVVVGPQLGADEVRVGAAGGGVPCGGGRRGGRCIRVKAGRHREAAVLRGEVELVVRHERIFEHVDPVGVDGLYAGHAGLRANVLGVRVVGEADDARGIVASAVVVPVRRA